MHIYCYIKLIYFVPSLNLVAEVRRLFLRIFSSAYHSRPSTRRILSVPFTNRRDGPYCNTRLRSVMAIEDRMDKYFHNVRSLIPPLRISPRLSSNAAYVSVRKSNMKPNIKPPKWFDAPPSLPDQGMRDDIKLRLAEHSFSITKYQVSFEIVLCLLFIFFLNSMMFVTFPPHRNPALPMYFSCACLSTIIGTTSLIFAKQLISVPWMSFPSSLSIFHLSIGLAPLSDEFKFN